MANIRKIIATLTVLASNRHPADKGRVSDVLTDAHVKPKDRFDLVQLAAAMSGFTAYRGIRSTILQQSASLAGITTMRASRLAAAYHDVIATLVGYDSAKHLPSDQTTSGRGNFGQQGGSRMRYKYSPTSFSLGVRVAEPLVHTRDLVITESDDED